jgi:hypothetical protein
MLWGILYLAREMCQSCVAVVVRHTYGSLCSLIFKETAFSYHSRWHRTPSSRWHRTPSSNVLVTQEAFLKFIQIFSSPVSKVLLSNSAMKVKIGSSLVTLLSGMSCLPPITSRNWWQHLSMPVCHHLFAVVQLEFRGDESSAHCTRCIVRSCQTCLKLKHAYMLTSLDVVLRCQHSGSIHGHLNQKRLVRWLFTSDRAFYTPSSDSSMNCIWRRVFLLIKLSSKSLLWLCNGLCSNKNSAAHIRSLWETKLQSHYYRSITHTLIIP